LIFPLFFWFTPGYLFYQGYWFGAEWIQNFIITATVLAASLVILLWQYRRRGTARSRLAAAGAMVFILVIPHLISMHVLMAMQMRLSKPRIEIPAIQIGLDPGRKEPQMKETGRRVGYEGTIAIALPLQVTALPDEISIISDDLLVEIAEPDGRASEA